jgi:hypothetical protein
LLEVDRGADRLAGRGEDAQRLVASKLEEGSTPRLDDLTRDVGELRRELGRGLVASLLGEQRVAANVRDQERPNLGLGPSVVPVRVTRPVGVRHAGIMLHAPSNAGDLHRPGLIGLSTAPWPIAR